MLLIRRTKTYKGLRLTKEQSLQVSSPQKIQEALLRPNCLGFYGYEGEEPIAFALLREFGPGAYFLWNFVVDLHHQGCGKGKAFLRGLVDMLAKDHSATLVTTTYRYGNHVAKRLYEGFGFVETDVVDEDGIHEVNMRYVVSQAPGSDPR